MTTMLKIKRSDGGVTIRRVLADKVDLKHEKKVFEARERAKGNNWSVVDIDIINEDEIPTSRTYRDAWNHDLEIDLKKAIPVQKRLITQKAHERVETDEFGIQDFSTVKAEMDALDFNNVKNIDELYNLWPSSIERRKGKRKYSLKDKKK